MWGKTEHDCMTNGIYVGRYSNFWRHFCMSKHSSLDFFHIYTVIDVALHQMKSMWLPNMDIVCSCWLKDRKLSLATILTPTLVTFTHCCMDPGYHGCAVAFRFFRVLNDLRDSTERYLRAWRARQFSLTSLTTIYATFTSHKAHLSFLFFLFLLLFHYFIAHGWRNNVTS